MNRRKGYTLIEILVGAGILALLLMLIIQFMSGKPKEAERTLGKMTARQEARLAFKRMCNEIRESSRIILPDNDNHFKTADYLYKHKTSDPTPADHYGPPANSLFVNTFRGDIVSYFFYHEPEGSDLDGNGRRDTNQLRRLNLTERVKDLSVKSRVIARGVRAVSDKPSIFTVARSFPGKLPSSVTIKMSLKEQELDDEIRYYSLVSSVFLRNIESLVETE